MANYIYLRVPTALAQFYRHRDKKHQLTEFQGVKFSSFDPAFRWMYNFLQIDGVGISHAGCFSQRSYNNMLQGRPPQGGKRIINRDETEWLTMQEICLLTGDKKIQRMEGYDYLCIEIPREIIIGGEYRPTNASHTMPPSAATSMVATMYDFLKFTLLDWVRQERRYCHKHGINLDKRNLTIMIDHFFYHYDICMGTNRKDRESMRRMAIRWIEESVMFPNDCVDFSDADDLNFIYESEYEDKDLEIKDLLKELKAGLKKS